MRQEHRWPEVAIHVTCAAAVVEVGEEEPDSLMKTLHGRGDLRHWRRRGDSLGRRCVGMAKMTARRTLHPEGAA
jgi:hypothetical protein